MFGCFSVASRLESAASLAGCCTGPLLLEQCRDVRVSVREGWKVLMTRTLEEGEKHGRSIYPKAIQKSTQALE